MSKNQSGFSVVEILTAIVIAGLIGTVGWLVYDRQKNTSDSDKKFANNNSKQVESPQWSESQTIDAGSKIESVDRTFSFIAPGGWNIVIYQDRNAVSSDGYCINNSCNGGFVDAPDQPVTIQKVSNKNVDFYAVRFAVFTEDKFIQKFTNEMATKSIFGPVDGVMGTKYYQKIPITREYQEGKEGHEIYEYSFEKNGKTYHVYYDVYGGEEKNKIDAVEQVIRSLKFN
ncbi:hypothetical protein HYU82_01330 [Candidatus Saccharibacteria bacterium]|nr:hypothetical protein [Candidatus Saccharibacteria bacterium]